MTAANAIAETINESGSTNEVYHDEDHGQLQLVDQLVGQTAQFAENAAPCSSSQPGEDFPGPGTTEFQGSQQMNLPQEFGDASGIDQQVDEQSPTDGVTHLTQHPHPLSMVPGVTGMLLADGQCIHSPLYDVGEHVASDTPGFSGDQLMVSQSGRCCWNCWEGELVLRYREYEQLVDKARLYKETCMTIESLRDQLYEYNALCREKDDEIEDLLVVNSGIGELKEGIVDVTARLESECNEHDKLKKIYDGLREEFGELEGKYIAAHNTLKLTNDGINVTLNQHKLRIEENFKEVLNGKDTQIHVLRQRDQLLQERISQYEVLINKFDSTCTARGSIPLTAIYSDGYRGRTRSRSPDAFSSETAKRRHELRKVLYPEPDELFPRSGRIPHGADAALGQVPPLLNSNTRTGGPKHFDMTEGDRTPGETQPPPAPHPETREFRRTRIDSIVRSAKSFVGRLASPLRSGSLKCTRQCERCSGPTLIDPSPKEECIKEAYHDGECDCGKHNLDFAKANLGTPRAKTDLTLAPSSAVEPSKSPAERAGTTKPESNTHIPTQCPACYQVYNKTEPGGKCHIC